MKEDCLDSLLKAGSIHRQVRNILKNEGYIKPNVKLYDITVKINDSIRKLTNNTGINGGIAFPPCVSMSHIMAHHCVSKGSTMKLSYDDNIKIDFGVHINGWIIDSAESIHFNPKYKEQHDITKEAMFKGIKEMGIDGDVNDVSETIQEIIESCEVYHNKMLYPLQVVNNLRGHGIGQYDIHIEPSIPNKINLSTLSTDRFTEGVFAVEPFSCIYDPNFTYGTTKNSYDLNNSKQSSKQNLNNPLYKKLYKLFGNMSFSNEHLEFYKINPNGINFRNLIKDNIVISYPDFIGTKGDIVCHYEHTVYMDDNKKIIVSL
jgi:methionyl aminopeptidase